MAGIFSNGIWHMGFDMDPAASAVFTGAARGSSVTSPTPFSFGYGWQLGNTDCMVLLNTNLTTLYIGAYVYTSSLPGSSSAYFYGFYDASAGNFQVTLQASSTGALQFFLGNSTSTPIGSASAAGTIAIGTWNYIEAKVVIGASSTGSVACNVNGTSVITASSVTTQSTANAWVSAFRLSSIGTATGTYDDWYMLDGTGASPLNTFLGPIQCRGEKANNNSAVAGRNAFTPTNPTNVNYTNVGNVPYNTSEYNYDNNAGDFDMYRFPTLPSNVATVLDVGEWAVVELDAAGSRTVSLDCYSASGTPTDSLGPAFTPLTSPTMYFQSNVVNPSGGGTWTPSTASAAELGVKVDS